MSAVENLRAELELMEAVIVAATAVSDEWRIRGDHRVDRDREITLTFAVNDLADWRDLNGP